jgi:hypothetical protein
MEQGRTQGSTYGLYWSRFPSRDFATEDCYKNRAWWLSPVILASPEGWRLDESWCEVQAKSSQDPISTNGWAWWYVPVMPAMQESINRMMEIQVGPGIK